MKINYINKNEKSIRDFLGFFHLGKAKIYNLLQNNQISINGNIVKNDISINSGDVISIEYDEEIDYKASNNDIDILYEDDYFLIVNKKSGIIIHDEKNSLCNDIAKYYLDNDINLSVKFPNRIDKETSGIMIFCKDMLTHSYMNYLFENHEIEKEYIAFIHGKLKNKKGALTYRIGRDRHDSSKMRVSSTGLESYTKYEVIKEYDNYSKVRCVIKTGRTHQIRVHMSYIGNPIIGDKLYGNDNYKNMALHAYRVAFIHPVNKKRIEIKCKLPEYMEELEI